MALNGFQLLLCFDDDHSCTIVSTQISPGLRGVSIHGSKSTDYSSGIARGLRGPCYFCRFLSFISHLVHSSPYLAHANKADSSRTMLLYPLSPFFVLFCNVVATSDQRDFEMIKKITDDLGQFAKANAPIGKLYGLFSKFLDLCTPLIKVNTGLPSSGATISSLPNDPSNVTMFGRGDRIMDTLPSPITSRASASGIPQPMEGWDDRLMWELFDNQPSLGWAESELWDGISLLSS